MTNRNLGKILIVLTLVAVLGFGANAFAGWGRGSGHGPGMGYGRGMGCGPGMGPGFGGFGYGSDLNAEDLKKLDEQRITFFEATKNLRNDIFEKRLELRSELAKQDPDAQMAAKLQKKISELETRFDQKRIDHMLAMKKINPNVGRGFGGRGRGFDGRGQGFGGRGQGFGGPCWR
ncbi:periplasmic heavy metal sensor [Thermodesulfobacteriota bacterium]